MLILTHGPHQVTARCSNLLRHAVVCSVLMSSSGVIWCPDFMQHVLLRGHFVAFQLLICVHDFAYDATYWCRDILAIVTMYGVGIFVVPYDYAKWKRYAATLQLFIATHWLGQFMDQTYVDCIICVQCTLSVIQSSGYFATSFIWNQIKCGYLQQISAICDVNAAFLDILSCCDSYMFGLTDNLVVNAWELYDQDYYQANHGSLIADTCRTIWSTPLARANHYKHHQRRDDNFARRRAPLTDWS